MTARPANPVSHLARQQQGRATRNRIVELITQYQDERGQSPTVRELADHLDLSTSVVQRHLAQMKSDGRIVREGPRTIRGYSYRVVSR